MKHSFPQLLNKIMEKGVVHYFRCICQLLFRFLRPRWQRLFIFESTLDGIIPNEFGNDIEIIRILDINDELRLFAEQRGSWYLTQARDLFSKGNICFAEVYDGKIVGCLWTSFHEVYLPDIEYTLKTPPDVVSLIDGYTLKEYRGIGLYEVLWNDCLNYLINTKKYTKIYGFVNNKNKRSLKVHDKLNLKKIIYDITLLKILGIRIHFKKNIV